MRRVVVTGIGALTPIGNSASAYLEGLQNGVSGANEITYFDPSNFKTRFACELKDFDPTEFVHKREIRRVDRFQLYAIIVADEAIADAGLEPEKLELDKVGVIWGSGIGGLRSMEKEVEDFEAGSGMPRYSPFMIPKIIPDLAPGLISIKYGFRGINYSTVSACASATHAIGTAFDYIRLGRNDVIVTGGSEAAVCKIGIGGFGAMKALSKRNDDFKTASRPFDAERDGFVLAEGGASLVLEELEHAKKRGAKIYGEVLGYGATADAHHITAPHPEGMGARNVMLASLEEAKLNPEDVDYVNVHGTSTPLGDIAEVKAIQQVFGDAAYNMNISSTKSMTGHLLGAAGAVEALACVHAINHKFVPPTINHSNPDPNIDPKLNLTFNEAQERKINVALSNTFGFGGHNASLIISRFEE